MRGEPRPDDVRHVAADDNDVCDALVEQLAPPVEYSHKERARRQNPRSNKSLRIDVVNQQRALRSPACAGKRDHKREGRGIRHNEHPVSPAKTDQGPEGDRD